MDIVKKYFCRFLKLWIIWFWFLALDGLGLVIDTFVPAFSPPRWLYWVIPAIGFLVANVKLFAEVESEKQLLQSRIDEFEDTRADIRFKNIGDFCYTASIDSMYFSSEGKTFHESGRLYKNGLPIGVIIGADLKGEKKSHEAGNLKWEIVEADLPPLLSLLESDKGSFEWPGGGLLYKISEWLDDFTAGYELPIKIAEQDPRLFAQSLSSLGSYRVVIQYRTIRGIDSESKPHSLILEGDFQEFRDDICDKWKKWFRDLAQLAECQ